MKKMKREYLEPKPPSQSSPNMFPKFPSGGRHPFSPHFPLRQPDQEDASSSGAAAPPAPGAVHQDRPSTGDGASIEVVRRPRGRPPGSKNKPKPPVVITRDVAVEPAMSPYVLEVPGGSDVVESISRFCRRKGIGLCVLTGTGTVADFTIQQPGSTPRATVTFHGRFEILSISATVLPAPMPFQVPNAFKISLVGPQGQVLGGAVVGPLIAAGPVFVIAASFNSPAYNRLPAADDEGNSSVSASGQSPPVSGSGDHGGGPPPPNPESCGMSMYSCHLGPDVIWAPTARPRQAPGPPPPPPYQ